MDIPWWFRKGLARILDECIEATMCDIHFPEVYRQPMETEKYRALAKQILAERFAPFLSP